MINNHIGRLVAITLLLGVSFASTFAQDAAQLNGDSATAALAKEHAVAEVRSAIAMCGKKEFTKAIPILKKHSDNGDIGATYVLAKLHSFGLGVEKAPAVAMELFAKNITDGHVPSMLALAKLKQTDSPAEAIQLIKQASAFGDPTSLTTLGSIYENGSLGVAANPKLAFKYYEKAAEKGHPFGNFHLARFYDDGIGVSANEVQSTRLYRKAAIGGVAAANPIMAKRYFEGKGIDEDPIAAIGWLTRGAQQGSTESMVVLGERYQRGDVVSKDLNQAGKLFSQAAKMGDPFGTYNLAMLYLKGTGTKADPVRAYVLLSGAQSLPKAQEALKELKQKLTASQLADAQKQVDAMKAASGSNQ